MVVRQRTGIAKCEEEKIKKLFIKKKTACVKKGKKVRKKGQYNPKRSHLR